MRQNVGGVDAWIRGTLAVGLFGLAAIFSDRPGVAVGAALVATVLALTALTRKCPLYALLGIDTAGRESQASGRG